MRSEALSGAGAWVRQQRAAGVSLQQLQVELNGQLSSLDSSLVQAVTTELPRLTETCGAVGATADSLRNLSATLDAHRDAASLLTKKIDARRTEFASAVDERTELLRQMDEVRLLRRLAEALTNLEALVVEPSDSDESPTLDVTVKRLLRASSECGRLLLLRKRAAAMPALPAHLDRLAAARAQLLTQLSECFHQALTAEEAAAAKGGGESASAESGLLADVIRAYGEAEGDDEACRWVRTQWVAPRLQPLLQTAAQAADVSLRSLGEVLQGFVDGPSFGALARADAEARQPLHLLSSGPWLEWCTFVSEGHTHVFGAGMPLTFHDAYLTFNDLISALGRSLPVGMAHRLRAHPATAAVHRRFNLPIYFQLRQQEVAKPLEAALAASESKVELIAGGTEGGGAAGSSAVPLAPALTTAAASALADAVRRCLARDVFLRPLASRLLRLVLQCLSRFCAWLEGMHSAGAMPVEGGGDAANGEKAAGESGEKAVGGALAEPEGATLLYLDLLVLIKWLRSQLSPALPLLLTLDGADDAELIAECNDAFAEACGSLEAQGEALRIRLVDGHAAACVALLSPVRAIAAAYRMTGKPIPTQPSFFVPQVLGPLRSFLGSSAHRLDAEARAVWARAVAAAVTSRYLELASTLLDTVRKDELARLRLSIPTAGGAGGGEVSDSHKICVQLCLDVQAFAAQLAAVGVDAAGLPEYATLQEAVRPEEGLVAHVT